jgi:hypothetical protein
MQSSIRSVSKCSKLSRPPGPVECGSREKYTSLARVPPIYCRRQRDANRPFCARDRLTSTATWLTTPSWCGSRISLVSYGGVRRPFPLVPLLGDVDLESTMKAPLTLMRTEPGIRIALSTSSVDASALFFLGRRPASPSSSVTTSVIAAALSVAAWSALGGWSCGSAAIVCERARADFSEGVSCKNSKSSWSLRDK